MTPLPQVIDKAAALCDGQNALARRIGVQSGWLSLARHGKKPLPPSALERLAELVGADPADLWLSQQDQRNPFKQGAVTTAGLQNGLGDFT